MFITKLAIFLTQ